MTKAILGAVIALLFTGAAAIAQSGPVATQCKDDIAKLCAGKQHNGDVRACLEAAKDKVAPACKTALDTTGPGKGGKGKN